MPKVNAREVAAVAGVVVAGVEAAQKVVGAVNADGRAGALAAQVGRRIAGVTRIGDPLDRIAAQLDIVTEAADNLAAQGHDADVDVAAGWSQEAQLIKSKLAATRVMERKTRKLATAALRSRTEELLRRVVTHGFDEPPAPPKRRKVLPGRQG